MGKTKSIEVDLTEDFTDDELVAELKERGYDFESECDCDEPDIEDFSTDTLIEELEGRGFQAVGGDTLDDRMKAQLIHENFENVTLKQLETFFNTPNK